MTNELKPTRRAGKTDDRLTRMEGSDPPLMQEPPLMTEKEIAMAAANVFEEDLVDPDQVRRDIDAAFPQKYQPDDLSKEYAEGDASLRNRLEAAQILAAGYKQPRAGLVARLAEVIAGLPDVQPEGVNAFFKYKFISDKQVLGLLRPRLSRAGIVIVPETVEEGTYLDLTTAKGGHSRMTRMLVTFRVMDAFGGESFTGQALGYGDDAGDKGANKAYTAAFKNFLIKLCMIGGERDIEEDEDTDKRAADAAGASRPITINPSQGVTGVKQGGRQTEVTAPQIKAIKAEVERLGITKVQLASAITAITGEEIAVEALTFAQAGEVIRALMASDPPGKEVNDEDVSADEAGDS